MGGEKNGQRDLLAVVVVRLERCLFSDTLTCGSRSRRPSFEH